LNTLRTKHIFIKYLGTEIVGQYKVVVGKGRKYAIIAVIIITSMLIASTIYVWIKSPGPQEGLGRETHIPGHGEAPGTGYVGANISSPVEISGGIKSFSSYDEILGFLSSLEASEAGEALPLLMQTPAVLIREPAIPMSTVSSPSLSAQAFSTTNVQVRGVDELDIVKTDGRLIVIFIYNKVYIVDAIGKRIISTISINGSLRGGFLWDRWLVAVASDGFLPFTPRIYALNTSVYTYDISDPQNPRPRERVSYTGDLVGARMINGTVYLVLSMSSSPRILPMVNGVPLRPSQIFLVDQMPSSFTTIASIDLSSGGRSEISLLISPTTWIYMSASRLYVVSYLSPYSLATGKAIEILSSLLPSNVSSRILEELARGNMSGAMRIAIEYLSTLERDTALSIISNASAKLSSYVFQEATRVHVLDVRGTNITYKGWIEIPGRILDQFSIEEYKGYLIAATTASNMSAKILVNMPIQRYPEQEANISAKVVECTVSKCVERDLPLLPGPIGRAPKLWISLHLVTIGETYNNVYIASLASMKIVGSLEDLARGERIYAARLLGDIFYLVTFRQVDPLYAIDIRNPEKPSILGFLKIPGFSRYLHPLPGNMLLGIGMENGWLKISLFNISEPKNIAEISSLKIEGAGSNILWDHHAFTIYPEKSLIMIPLAIAKASGYLSGIAVLSYSSEGVKMLRILEHRQAIRAIYIEETIYTISQDLVKLFNINTFEKVAEIPLK
jgi:inhibitor of cysteine peptidase